MTRMNPRAKSTESLISSPPSDHLPASGQVLRLRARGLHCCVELGAVVRVLPLMSLQALPGGPACLVGLMNLAGKSVPVIDLGLRIGLRQGEPYHVDTPVVLCRLDDRQVGLIVDEVLGSQPLQDMDLQMHAELTQGSTAFEAVVDTADGLCLYLNLAEIMAVDFSSGAAVPSVEPEWLERHGMRLGS